MKLKNIIKTNKMDFIFLKNKSKFEKLLMKDILYIKCNDNLVIFFTKEKGIIVRSTIKTLEEKLPKNKFLRVHRTYMVNINHIDYILHDEIYIGEDTVIPIGYKNKKELLSKFIII